jgi:hypothetical protein
MALNKLASGAGGCVVDVGKKSRGSAAVFRE